MIRYIEFLRYTDLIKKEVSRWNLNKWRDLKEKKDGRCSPHPGRVYHGLYINWNFAKTLSRLAN